MDDRDAAEGQPTDATISFRAVTQPADEIHEPTDATISFQAITQPADETYEPTDATISFRAITQPADEIHEPADATMSFRAVTQPVDTTGGLSGIDRDRSATTSTASTASTAPEAARPVGWRHIRVRRPTKTTLVFAGWVAAVWVIAAVLFIFTSSHPH
jgi:hypothetical protein